MANLLDIRHRIRSVKSTQQITRAMKMVAAAKLRKSQGRILAARPYAEAMNKVLSSLITRVEKEKHPLLQKQDVIKGVYLVVVTGDRGLCGAFNSNAIRMAEHYILDHPDVNVQLMLVGKKANDYFKHHPHPVFHAVENIFSSLEPDHAKSLMETLLPGFLEGKVQRILVAHNEFKSLVQQNVTLTTLLPIDPMEFEDPNPVDYLYEPDAATLLRDLLPLHVEFQIWRILLESAAAEHAARMTAMEGATRNAEEMIDSLTLVYNQTRQAAITRELIEIISGAQVS